MKYKLNKDCIYSLEDRKVVLTNMQTKTRITFTDIYADIFKAVFVKKIDTERVVNDLKNDKRCIDGDARKSLNAVIYVVLNSKNLVVTNKYVLPNRKKLFVTSCLLEMTNVCNFRCPHCYVDKCENIKLTYNDVEQISNELKELGCSLITLTGGEVFTHPDFIKIYLMLYNKGFIININTNASMLNEDILNLFNLCPPCSIEVSLYGECNASYEHFTKTINQFDRVIENVNKLRNIGIKVVLKNVVTNSNKYIFNDIKKLSSKVGCQFKFDYIVFPNMANRGVYNPEQIDVNDALKFIGYNSSLEEYYLRLYSKPRKKKNNLFKCKNNDDAIFITSNKRVCMCLCMQDAGVKYTKLSDNIIELAKLKNIKLSKISRCKNCKYMPICRYCPGKFEMITGDYQTPPQWFCDFGKSIFDKFIKGFKIVRKKYFKDFELDAMAEIIAKNMVILGVNATSNELKMWKENMQALANRDDYFLYLIYQDGAICGFAELCEGKDGLLYLAEIQLAENVKGTRVLLKTLQFLAAEKDFERYDAVYFNINNKNEKSKNTFMHLGGVVIEKREKTSLYRLDKQVMLNTLSHFRR